MARIRKFGIGYWRKKIPPYCHRDGCKGVMFAAYVETKGEYYILHTRCTDCKRVDEQRIHRESA
jgi:hypothetical protein